MATELGPSPADTPGAGHCAEPSRHVPLHNAVCVLCRYPIWNGDKIAAVIGKGEAFSYSAFTLGFSFPEYDAHPFQSTKVYQKDLTAVGRLCRLRPCSVCPRDEDGALYHIDCYQVISRQFKPLRLWEIWTIARWSQPFPNSQYLAWSSLCSGFPSNVGPKLDSLASSVSMLPEELRDNIIQRCRPGLYLRLLMALHRRGFYSSLTDEAHVERELSFSDVVSWSRADGLNLGHATHDWVRIRLDDFGVVRLRAHDNRVDKTIPDLANNLRYMVEKTESLKDSCIQIRGRYLRIRAASTLRIWESPRPSIPEASWYDKDKTAPPVFVRSIFLRGLTGITAFCRKGKMHWIHPHYAGEEEIDAPLPAQDNFHPSERATYTPIFYPLLPDEEIESIWVRYRGFRGTRDEVTLIPSANSKKLVTNFGRPLMMGKYEHPSHAGVAFAPVQLNVGKHLLLPCHNPTYSDQNFAVLKMRPPKGGGGMMMVPQNLTRALLSPLDVSIILHLSVAPFANIKGLRFFYKSRPDAAENQCVGIIIEYYDTAFEAVGSCYGWAESKVVSEPVKLQAYREENCMNIRYSPAPVWGVEVLDNVTHHIEPGDTLLWWFDDRGLQMVESEASSCTRYQQHYAAQLSSDVFLVHVVGILDLSPLLGLPVNLEISCLGSPFDTKRLALVQVSGSHRTFAPLRHKSCCRDETLAS
ncbi:LOW QUALITY PROTEIN: hypothetical protein HJFPF1_05065 [Paramyrothecium foliicola]|nr:LOW QUALITY PROTEIN: hypothetical protein HJFPF1_05065 [Paramyrothecium foliicola]